MSRELFINKYYSSAQSSLNERKCLDDVLSQPVSSLDLELSSDDILSKLTTIRDFFVDPSKRFFTSVTPAQGNEVTPKSVVKSVLTDYIVSDISINESTRIFLYIINQLCRSFFTAYRDKTGEDYRLIYKGGNTIAIYFYDFIDNYFNSELRPEIYTKYGTYFKNSDIDFTVENFNINTKRSRIQQADCLAPMLWYILSIARLVILTDMRNLYDFCNISFSNMNEQMRVLLSNIKKSLKPFNDFNNVEFIGIAFDKYIYLPHRSLQEVQIQNKFSYTDVFSIENDEKIKDGFIPKFFVDGNSLKVDGLNVNLPEDDSYKTYSYVLDHFNENSFDHDIFKKPFNEIVSSVLPKQQSQLFLSSSLNTRGNNEIFLLSRLMLNFNIIYTKDDKIGVASIPSELYDITYVSEVIRVVSHLELKYKFNNYNYKFVDSDGSIIEDDIIIMSEFEIVNDLIDILFIENIFPWNDKKYQKRLIRLIFISRYIEEKNRINPVQGLNVNPFLMKNIITKYLPIIRRKINTFPTQDQQKNEEEFEKMKRVIVNTQKDIDSYFSRTDKRLNVESNITRLKL
jgi:hypothetical protein